MKELQTLGIAIDFQGMVVVKEDLWIPTHDAHGTWVSRKVVVRKTVVIPARCEQLVIAHVVTAPTQPGDQLSAYLMEPELALEETHGIMSAVSLHDKTSGDIPVLIQNPTNQSVTLVPDMILGHVVDPMEAKWAPAKSDNSQAHVAHEVVMCDPSSEAGKVGAPQQLPSHLTDLYERSCTHLNELQKSALQKLLIEVQDVFSKNNYDIGRTDRIEYVIDTSDATPVKQAPQWLNPEAAAAADEIVDELLVHKLIEPSDSPWASPIVMVKRKDGRFRMCIDYREVNKRTINQTAWPLPRIDDTLENLSGAQWFCTNDLTSGYWQVPLGESSRWPSAFCTSRGLFQWKVLPFGFGGGPGKFMELMDDTVGDQRYTSCMVFLDDCLVFGKTVDETLANYREFCSRMRKAKLKLKPSKCALFQKSVSFLGHTVSVDGIGTDPEKVAAVKDWPRPKSRKHVRSFLGLVGYYRKFIPSCSTIAKPLTELTSPNVEFVWTKECESAFNALKQCLTEAPILGYPREDGGQYILDTDASDYGIGAILSQVQEGREVVLAYASRTLSPAECNYCVTRKELLAIVHHARVFKSYLLGRNVLVRTDHSSLKYLHRFKQPEGQLARWIDFLQAYTFTIEHRPGRQHSNADALSRRPDPCGGKKCYCEIFGELQYDPSVVMESHGVVEVAVQATPEGNGSETWLRCCAYQRVPHIQLATESIARGTQTGDGEQDDFAGSQKRIQRSLN